MTLNDDDDDAYLTFMLCISTLEVDFSSKQTYLGVVEQFITENDHCRDVACENCRVVMKVNVIKALSCFANTLLNNYSKDTCKGNINSKV